jgi:hypothetical protein
LRNLFSALTKCAECGGYVMCWRDGLVCFGALPRHLYDPPDDQRPGGGRASSRCTPPETDAPGHELKIMLKADLAGMLNAARDSKRSPDTGDLLVQIRLVAGARNHLNLEFAWAAA